MMLTYLVSRGLLGFTISVLEGCQPHTVFLERTVTDWCLLVAAGSTGSKIHLCFATHDHIGKGRATQRRDVVG